MYHTINWTSLNTCISTYYIIYTNKLYKINSMKRFYEFMYIVYDMYVMILI